MLHKYLWNERWKETTLDRDRELQVEEDTIEPSDRGAAGLRR